MPMIGHTRTAIPAVASVGLLLCGWAACTTVTPPPELESSSTNERIHYRVVLTASLEDRRPTIETQVDSAVQRITVFAHAHGWDSLAIQPFMDSVMVFDVKKDFDRQLLLLAGADTTMQLPATYCGALEKRTLLVVAPEIYAAAYPEGVEAHSWVKLLTHEIAHQLHVRILQGDEEAMGPVWFYEGFAIYAADQLRGVAPALSPDSMRAVMDDPERGSYAVYGAVFRHFAAQHTIKELIGMAAEPQLTERLLGAGQ